MTKILILNSHLNTSHESVSETDNATPTTTTCPYANDFHSFMKQVVDAY